MRICIVGDFTGNLDEGMRNTTFYLSRELSKRHQILAISPRKVLSKAFWTQIKSFAPQIIHYVPGPSILSFMILKALALYCGNAKTVMSAIHPQFLFLKRLIPLLKPDLILTQSSDTEKMFTKLGCETKFLPSGVDVERFTPVPKMTKVNLRMRYKVAEGKFVILHVGNIRKGRNIGIFKSLQRGDNQVIIVGSTSIDVERSIYRELKQIGFKVWTNYFKNIEEVYMLSDCYVFPTVDRARSIELPLSVMEAMSCNLPVISTKFGALPRVFKDGEGLIFIEEEDAISSQIEKIKSGNIEIKTRGKVLPYSWTEVANKLEEIYYGVTEGN